MFRDSVPPNMVWSLGPALAATGALSAPTALGGWVAVGSAGGATATGGTIGVAVAAGAGASD